MLPSTNAKAIVRFFYAYIPGLALARFAIKDFTAPYFFKPEYRGICSLSIENELIIDVGANRGQSIAAFKRLVPECKIVAFEPERDLVERLTLRFRRDPTITIRGCAIGEHSGSMTFFVPHYGWWDCDGMSATNHKEATEWLRNPRRMLHFNEAKLIVKEYPVECRTLDSYELSPSLIKLHAQGAELEILKGSRQTICQHKPALMCAFPKGAVSELLADWGYQPYSYKNGNFIPGVAKPPTTFTWYLADIHSRGLSIGR